VAGNVIGNGGGNYRLEITCIDETLAAPNPSMSPGVLNQQFLNTDGWQAGGPAGTSAQAAGGAAGRADIAEVLLVVQLTGVVAEHVLQGGPGAQGRPEDCRGAKGPQPGARRPGPGSTGRSDSSTATCSSSCIGETH
jgi:hypothetical protein